VLVRTRVSEIREMGRATQGVTLINVDEGTHLSGVQRVVETDHEEAEAIIAGEGALSGELSPGELSAGNDGAAGDVSDDASDADADDTAPDA